MPTRNARLIDRYRFLFLAGILFVMTALYAQGIHGNYFGDDFQFVFKPLPPNVFYYFSHINELNVMAYRPIQAVIMTVIQQYAGTSTMPLHCVSIAIHGLMVCLVYYLVRRLGFTLLAALIASAVMAFSQVNVHAVMSNDTLSQSLCALFSVASIASFAAFALYSGRRSAMYCVLSFLLFLLALFSKETGVSAILGIMFAGVVGLMYKPSRSSLIRVASAVVVFSMALLAFYFIRNSITTYNAAMGNERYTFGIGFNVIRNLIQYMIAAFMPVSTVAVFTALKTKSFVILGSSAVLMAAYAVIMKSGLYLYLRSRPDRFVAIAFLGVCTITGSVPVIFLNHVSELYSYNSMPFIAALAGIGIAALFEHHLAKNIRIAAALTGVVLICTNIAATSSKIGMMVENGDSAEHYIAALEPYVRNAPENASIALCQTLDASLDYSVFRLTGFNVINYGLKRLNQLTGRWDVSLEVIDGLPAKNDVPGGDFDVYLYIKDGAVVTWSPE